LMSIINRLGSRVEVRIKVRRAEMTAHRVPASRVVLQVLKIKSA
jgi:hypothetical protein